MLTGKQRGHLRALANDMPAVLQVGKGGINDNMIKQFDDALEARELIKASVLKNSIMDAREACEQIAGLTGAEVVQVVGNRFILYRESVNNRGIELP